MRDSFKLLVAACCFGLPVFSSAQRWDIDVQYSGSTVISIDNHTWTVPNIVDVTGDPAVHEVFGYPDELVFSGSGQAEITATWVDRDGRRGGEARNPPAPVVSHLLVRSLAFALFEHSTTAGISLGNGLNSPLQHESGPNQNTYSRRGVRQFAFEGHGGVITKTISLHFSGEAVATSTGGARVTAGVAVDAIVDPRGVFVDPGMNFSPHARSNPDGSTYFSSYFGKDYVHFVPMPTDLLADDAEAYIGLPVYRDGTWPVHRSYEGVDYGYLPDWHSGPHWGHSNIWNHYGNNYALRSVNGRHSMTTTYLSPFLKLTNALGRPEYVMEWAMPQLRVDAVGTKFMFPDGFEPDKTLTVHLRAPIEHVYQLGSSVPNAASIMKRATGLKRFDAGDPYQTGLRTLDANWYLAADIGLTAVALMLDKGASVALRAAVAGAGSTVKVMDRLDQGVTWQVGIQRLHESLAIHDDNASGVPGESLRVIFTDPINLALIKASPLAAEAWAMSDASWAVGLYYTYTRRDYIGMEYSWAGFAGTKPFSTFQHGGAIDRWLFTDTGQTGGWQ